jgi:repressor LexA
MLNDRAREILSYIERFQREKGYPPTIREIGSEFDIHSTNGVRYYLNMLEKAGYLRRRLKISRGIESVRPQKREVPGIPILGRVAAGEPILAEQSWDGHLDTSEIFGDPAGLFALRVKGDSMIDAGILENDYVIVRHQESAATGQIIVALVEDEATVKYYHPRRDRIELVAANPRYEPIVVAKDSGFRILGVVSGVMRTIAR